MELITGTKTFRERSAIADADFNADHLARLNRAEVRCCCPRCGSVDGWEEWDWWQVGQVRDSILLAVGVWLLTGQRILWYSMPTFYRRDSIEHQYMDAEHLYTRCRHCKPPTDGAVTVRVKEVQEWLKEEL